ncbi:MAG: prepilin-type N-terminal cleavage/methylation domain-containing protein [Fuerstiella sp.]
MSRLYSSRDTVRRCRRRQSGGTGIPSFRRGFTLIEVTLAVALTTMLMAALYSAMSIYWNVATESYDQIERAQIARALLRDMARDIQSCTFVEQETATESDDTGDDGMDAGVDADTALGSYTNGLFGTDNDLVLYISRPDPDQDYVNAQELIAPSDRSSDAMIVRYLLISEGGGGLSGQFAGDTSLFSVDDPIKGLARMQGDLAGLSNAISTGDVEMQLLATTMLAEEVGQLRFQYFDGVDYFDEWDSTAQNAMPLAVVIELTLRKLPSSSDSRPLEEQPGYLPPTVHRLVVPILVAKPYVGETAI